MSETKNKIISSTSEKQETPKIRLALEEKYKEDEQKEIEATNE